MVDNNKGDFIYQICLEAYYNYMYVDGQSIICAFHRACWKRMIRRWNLLSTIQGEENNYTNHDGW